MTTITVNPAQYAQDATTSSSFQSQSSFAQKLINVQIQLASAGGNNQPNTFAETGANVVTLSGHRIRARISWAGTPAGSTADISIYGLTQSLMNQLTTLGVVGDMISRNSIILSAGQSMSGDASAAAAAAGTPSQGFSVVFGGTIYFAYGDYNNMPEVPFRITAQTGLFNAVQSVAPSSFTGPTSIVQIMQGFANQLGVAFENNGVSGTLSNPYFPGTLLDQVYQAAEHANIHAQLVDGGTKLAIWPFLGSRTSLTNIPLISPETGMIGYPSFAANGFMVVKMIYNPDVRHMGNIQVQSSIPQANKTWTVYKVDLALDSLVPNGEWMMTAYCYPKNLPAPVPPVS
jgi:baseplate hub protein gp41